MEHVAHSELKHAAIAMRAAAQNAFSGQCREAKLDGRWRASRKAAWGRMSWPTARSAARSARGCGHASGIGSEMQHQYFSLRKGLNKNPKGLPLGDIRELIGRVLAQLKSDGHFDEAFGFTCVDEVCCRGRSRTQELEILLEIRKKNLWPVGKTSMATRKTTCSISWNSWTSMSQSRGMAGVTTMRTAACTGRRSIRPTDRGVWHWRSTAFSSNM